MNEYVLLFRMDLTTPGAQPSQAELDEYMVGWMRWMDGLAAKGQLTDGNHFATEGRVVRKGSVDRNPYHANAESVAGYVIVTAPTLEAAVEIAKGCPILEGERTSVEVRGLDSPGTAEPR